VRLSRALLTRALRANADARYRVDFFAVVPRQGVFDEAEPTTWAVVDRMYIEDAKAPEVLDWAQRQAGPGGRFAAYVEHSIVRDETELLVVSLIAGDDPTPPGYRAELFA
jgi:hypothetical protein